ncbi:MAG: hypothetical protein GWN30_09820 [Gammaproteobacteria bacterium]|nr:hypothetical protein [Gammaproteobacteria bacterium]
MLEWMDGDPIVPEIRPIYQRSEEDPEDLVSTLEEIDDTFTSIIEVDGAEESMTTITELLEQLRSVAKTWEAQINISTSGGVPSPGTGNEPEMAFGGPVQQGASYFVGERGPELFVPNQNGYLYPNGTGPGGGVTNIYNYNKDAAAVSMAMLGMRRRQGVDSLAGLA